MAFDFYSKPQLRSIWNLQGPSHLGCKLARLKLLPQMAECIVKKSNNGEYKYPSYAQTNFHFLEFLMYTHMS